ncbi:hypothetical protein [Verrucomicrobium spinosum]|uniref:hypothetical protein n=1 Tax=Verrucomicrobium spinosum TaxID=2736 RepID=UPI000A4932D4|nr:hypothetical protein [Verrucomicrobium spinosum]
MGIGWRQNADGFREGRQALRPITLFDASSQRVQRAGEVVFDQPLPPTRLGRRQLARLDRASRLLIHAGTEAFAQSGWTANGDADGPPAAEIPIVLGTSAGAMAVGESYYRQKVETPGTAHSLPHKVILYQPHTQAQFLADAWASKAL